MASLLWSVTWLKCASASRIIVVGGCIERASWELWSESVCQVERDYVEMQRPSGDVPFIFRSHLYRANFTPRNAGQVKYC